MDRIAWAYERLYESPYTGYLMAAFGIVALVLFFTLAKRLTLRHLADYAKRTKTDLDDFALTLIQKIGAPVFITVSLYLVTLPLPLIPAARMAIRYALILVLTVRAITLGTAIARYAVKKFYERSRPGDPTVDAMTKTMSGIIGAALWSLGVVFLLDNFGFDITTLVAGLGIGGIAVAMASQAILGDVFSAISIFIDRPFEVGDFIIVDDKMGSVEYIGLKTTRIRSLSGEQLVFANSDLTKSRIQNYKRMQTRRVAFTFGVPLETPLGKLKKIASLAAEAVTSTNNTSLERAHYLKIGAYAHEYEVAYYVLSADYNLYADVQQEINLKLGEWIEREGAHFAMPTQLLKFDGKMDGAPKHEPHEAISGSNY